MTTFNASGEDCPFIRFEMTDTNDRPLLTFAVFAYNQEQFIAEAVRGALSQTYSPLEIILSDDCSSDRTFEIMQEMAKTYTGPNQVTVRRNERNLGLIGHINCVMELVQGELIVVAAGDDISLPERTEKLFQAYQSSGGLALSLYSRANRIDVSGKQLDILEDLKANSQHSLEYMANHQVSVVGSAHAWHRKLFDIFGPMDEHAVSEDVILPFRAKLLGEVLAVDDVLVLRRHHAGNIWLHPTGSDFTSMVQWQTEKFGQRIENLIGIHRTKLGDLDRLELNNNGQSDVVQRLRPLVDKSLGEAQFEKAFLQANFFHRLGILINGLRKKVPIFRLVRWLVQYSFPGLYYRINRLRQLKDTR